MRLSDAKIKRERRAAYVAQPAPWADLKEVAKLKPTESKANDPTQHSSDRDRSQGSRIPR
jgi:hypothetical protein